MPQALNVACQVQSNGITGDPAFAVGPFSCSILRMHTVPIARLRRDGGGIVIPTFGPQCPMNHLNLHDARIHARLIAGVSGLEALDVLLS